MSETCEECDKPIMLWLEDGTGFCFEHAIEYCEDELKKQQFEEETGISELDIINRAMEKKISFKNAKAELLKEGEK